VKDGKMTENLGVQTISSMACRGPQRFKVQASDRKSKKAAKRGHDRGEKSIGAMLLGGQSRSKISLKKGRERRRIL